MRKRSLATLTAERDVHKLELLHTVDGVHRETLRKCVRNAITEYMSTLCCVCECEAVCEDVSMLMMMPYLHRGV